MILLWTYTNKEEVLSGFKTTARDVLFYGPFDRSMGLWIINEFLKLYSYFIHVLSVKVFWDITE